MIRMTDTFKLKLDTGKIIGSSSNVTILRTCGDTSSPAYVDLVCSSWYKHHGLY